MTPLLAARHVSVSFQKNGFVNPFCGQDRRVRILDDVSLAINAGETLGLVGESGSGKTTLARAMLGLQPIQAGEIQFNGQPLAKNRRLRRDTAMMFQDPVASLSPRLRVGELLTEPFRIHGGFKASPEETARQLLAMVGLADYFAQRFPHELSGGQARRVGVARALALSPQLVVADEPTAGLDVSVQGEVLNLMTRLKKRHSLSYMIVTHNLAMVRHVSDRLSIMYMGRIVEVGPTDKVFGSPAHPYTRMLLEAEPVPDPRRRHSETVRGDVPGFFSRPTGCEFHTRCPIATARCKNEAPQSQDLQDGRTVHCHTPLVSR